MKRPQQDRGPVDEALDAAKMQFIAEWRSGGQPTVQQYITRYPMFAQELTEFILTFVEMERAEENVLDEAESSSLLARALARAEAKREPTPSLTLMELAKASEITMPDIEAAVALPGRALLQILRGQLLDWNKKLVHALSQALRRREEEIHAALQVAIQPQALATGNYRATGNGRLKIPPLQRKSFRQLLEECPELTPEQRQWWLTEED